jgi:gamma-glutamylcyclotransferase (GGCT)/AIG2-like uncharacterized protein YtfP
MINELLFVYGTLLNSDNEFAAYLSSNSTLFSTGRFKGKLYDIGDFPGAIADNTDQYVMGSICKLNHPEQVLKTLDVYEGYGPGQPQPYLFTRELLPIETPNGTVNCWIYLYNLSVEGRVLISSGNYPDYLAKK